MVVKTKACLKSIFWSVFPLVARNTDVPTKKVIIAEIKKLIQFWLLYMRSTKPDIIIKPERGIINMLSI